MRGNPIPAKGAVMNHISFHIRRNSAADHRRECFMNVLPTIALSLLLPLSVAAMQAQISAPVAGANGAGAAGAADEPVRVSGEVAKKLEAQYGVNLTSNTCKAYINPMRLQGVMEGELTVSPEGKVIHVKDTVNTLPRFCHGVGDLANISSWLFKPYLVDGKPVAFRTTVHYDIAPGNVRHTYK
jgi:hypothetical protein